MYTFRIENSITTFPCFSMRCIERIEGKTRRCNRIISSTVVGLSSRLEGRGIEDSFFERGGKLECCVAQKELRVVKALPREVYAKSIADNSIGLIQFPSGEGR